MKIKTTNKSGSSNRTLMRKADGVLADLATNGGKLQPQQIKRFIRKMILAPTMLKAVRTVPMLSDEMEIDKIAFTNQFFYPDVERTPLPDEQRSKVDTSKIQLVCFKAKGEVQLSYDSLLENIEGEEDFTNTVLDLVAQRAAADVENILINGDTGSSNPFLAMQDGILKRVSSNTVDADQNPVSFSLFNKGFKALPKVYRQRQNLSWMTTSTVEADYQEILSDRRTPYGDTSLQDGPNLRIGGIPLNVADYMPDSVALLSNPKNFIVGIRKSFTLEGWKDIRAGVIIFVMRTKLAFAIEEETAVSKCYNIAELGEDPGA